LGNEKPLFLGLTEKSLWKNLVKAALTGNSREALNDFIHEFEDLELRFNSLDMDKDWYSPLRK
jgi:hypothetical protein